MLGTRLPRNAGGIGDRTAPVKPNPHCFAQPCLSGWGHFFFGGGFRGVTCTVTLGGGGVTG